MNALSPPQPDRPFHGLWSLWDMLRFEGDAFYRVTSVLSAVRGIIQGNVAHRQKKLLDVPQVYFTLRGLLIRNVRGELIKHLNVLGAPISAMAAEDLAKLADDENATFERLEYLVGDLENTLRREMQLVNLFVMSAAEVAYFDPPNPLFGRDFQGKFLTGGVFELDEAAKCFAINRPTACVFHLMRIMEIGVAP